MFTSSTTVAAVDLNPHITLLSIFESYLLNIVLPDIPLSNQEDIIAAKAEAWCFLRRVKIATGVDKNYAHFISASSSQGFTRHNAQEAVPLFLKFLVDYETIKPESFAYLSRKTLGTLSTMSNPKSSSAPKSGTPYPETHRPDLGNFARR